MPRPYRSPWPADMVFGGVPLMLGIPDPKKPGAQLVATKPQDLAQVAPPTFGYDAAPPLMERVKVYSDLSGGFGQKMQQSDKDTRYYYTLNMDWSAGTVGQKGPAVTSLTPATVDTTYGVTQFYEGGGNLYALNGRYVLYRQDDSTWPVSKDFGVNTQSVDAIAFYSPGLAQTYVYVAVQGVNMWRHDLTSTTTNWVQHGSLQATCWAVTGHDLWRGYQGAQLAKVDTSTDPWVAGNWTAPNTYSVGDLQRDPVKLVVTIAGTLIILKRDGPYTLDAEGNDHALYPYLKFGTTADDGRYFGLWQNDVYMGYGRSVLRIKPTLTFSLLPHLPVEEIGPERVVDNDSPVRGEVTAMAGHEDFCLYAGIYNVDTGNSYLLKFGNWDQDLQTGQPVRAEVWHGSITAAFVAKKMTAMLVSTIGAPASHKRLYMGFADGSVAWFTLPCTPNPMACTSYLYSSANGFTYYPFFDGGFRNDPKIIKAFTVSGLNLSSTQYANVQLAPNPTDAFQYVTDGATLGVGNVINFNESPRQKVWLPTGVSGDMIQSALVAVSGNVSPQITSLGIHYAVRPWYGLSYEFDVLADRFVTKRNGAPSPKSADDVRNLLKTAAQSTVPSTVVLPDETTAQLAVVGYSESVAWNERLRRWHESIHIQAVDFTPQPVVGTWSRMSAFTWGELAIYAWSELTGL